MVDVLMLVVRHVFGEASALHGLLRQMHPLEDELTGCIGIIGGLTFGRSQRRHGHDGGIPHGLTDVIAIVVHPTHGHIIVRVNDGVILLIRQTVAGEEFAQQRYDGGFESTRFVRRRTTLDCAA